MSVRAPAMSWCLTCGDRTVLIFDPRVNIGPADMWECGRGHRWHTRRCPTCGFLGTATREAGLYECVGSTPHLFWAARHVCECGAGVPVCPESADVWVCEACDQWEAITR